MCTLFHENQVGIAGNDLFSYLFCPNTGTKFLEPCHSNHMIPRLGLYSNNNIKPHNVNDVKISHGSLQSYWMMVLFCSVSRKTACRCFICFSISVNIRLFVRVLVEKNINISNKLNFSDVHQSVNYIGSLANLHEPLWSTLTLHATQCGLHFDNPQKYEIHSLNKHRIWFSIVEI